MRGETNTPVAPQQRVSPTRGRLGVAAITTVLVVFDIGGAVGNFVGGHVVMWSCDHVVMWSTRACGVASPWAA
ncbi:hypothetical protein [Streptomyces sp. bgisy060]|uniref:hypothetical protein n=2 Tax=unclassified Streptomyces TaxID=2593676 RepID=UPI003EBA78E8